MATEIALGELSATIASATGSPPPGGYKKLLALAMDGRLPGASRRNGRWHIRADALGQVIAALGMEPRQI